MRHLGLVVFGVIRVMTNILWPVIDNGDYWYFLGQTMFETYALFYALTFAGKKGCAYFFPVCVLFSLSLINLFANTIDTQIDPLLHLVFGVVLTVAIAIIKEWMQ